MAWSSSAPKAQSKWTAHSPGNSAAVDHSTWDRILRKYVRQDSRGLNRFAYSKVSASDKAALEDYIQSLSEVAITQRSRAVGARTRHKFRSLQLDHQQLHQLLAPTVTAFPIP